MLLRDRRTDNRLGKECVMRCAGAMNAYYRSVFLCENQLVYYL